MKLRIKAGLAALLAALLLTLPGCGGIVQPGEESPYSRISAPSSASGAVSAQTGSQSVVSEPAYSAGLDYESTGILNPLTGQTNLPAEAEGRRSVSVVINNYRAALPHNGISQADMVFECEAEGGITRLLAFYSDWKNAPKIGSIREARLYFLDIAQSLDSIMLYYGADGKTNKAVSERQYSLLNAMRYPDLTYRDEQLKQTRALEHTVVTDGTLINRQIENNGTRTKLLPTAPASAFAFSAEAAPLTLSRYRVRTIYLPVGGNAEYRYDPQKGVYRRYSFGTAMSDLNDGSAVELSNVLVLFAKQYPDPADQTMNCIDLTGSAGEGYYFTMGTGDKIYWQKGPNPADPIVLYDGKGDPMTLNQGKTWVNIIPQTMSGQVTWSEIAS